MGRLQFPKAPAAAFLLPLLLGATQGAPRYTRPALVWEKSLAPGLIYRMEVDPNLPRTVNAIRISPQSPTLRWMPELAGKTINEEGSIKGRLTPTVMAEQAGAIVAVNGDFFSYDQGAPIGQLVRSGELITTAVKSRAVFAWGPKDLAVGFASSHAFVTLGEGNEVPLESVNQPPGVNGLYFYTPAEGKFLTTRSDAVAVVKMPPGSFSPSTTASGTIDSFLTDVHEVPVTPGSALVVATGDKIPVLAALKPGDKVTVRFKTDGFDWEKYENEIGGGPFLVRDGNVAVDAEQEGFNADFQGRHPRTAIGKTPEGDVWIVTVDGRQTCSVGATLEELARLMRRLGCTDAINLDGGGSTALNIFGLTVSRPSDGVERPVSSGILIFGPRPGAPAGTPKIVFSPKPEADGTIRASVRLEGRLVDNADVLWSARGAAWIDQGGYLHPIHAGKAAVYARVYGQPAEANLTLTAPQLPDSAKIPVADRG